MRQEVVGLGLVGVAADRHDHIREFGILIAVVELADAHFAGGMAFGVVGRPIVNPDERRLERREHQLASAPGVLETTARTTVIKTIER